MDKPVLDKSYTRLRVKWSLFFKWFDFWIGVYIAKADKTVYICPIPMFGIKIWWWTETLEDRSVMDGWRQAVDYIEAYYKLDKDIGKAIAGAKQLGEDLK